MSIVIREWIFDLIPRLELTIADDGTMHEAFNLEDQTEITIELSRTNTEEGSVTETFILDNWSVDYLIGGGKVIYTITAIKKAENLFFPIRTRSFKNKTSIKVLEQIANECKLIPDILTGLSTNDSMTWIQCNTTNFNMIKHVLKRANVNDDAFLSFIDMDNKLRITSLKKECQKKAVANAKFSIENVTADAFAETADANTIWYNGYMMKNIMGTYNKQFGYGAKYSYYDLTKNVIASTPDTAFAPFTTNDFQHGDTVENINYGLLTDNVFSDYFKSQINNKYYKNISFGNKLSLAINSLYPIKLLDRVNVSIPSTQRTGWLNEVYSGDYIVCGILHNADYQGVFQKEISLHRNGFNDNPYGV